jgi:N-methylhydantoinase A
MTDDARILGVDVGGTFTDLVLLDPGSELEPVRIAKVPTTPENQAQGVLAALAAAGVEPTGLGTIVHGTTTTTNALLERKIARTGLITTKGFRDVLELGRRTRPRPYGMTGIFEPLIPRELRLEVAERIDFAGRVLVPLAEDEVAAAARRLLDLGCEAVVVHFLHAYANPDHELRAGEIVRASWPNPYVTLGHRVVSEYREFERGTAAAVNACVQPVLHRYVERLGGELAARGFRAELLVMQGNGGTVSARIVAEEAAKTVMSGPASGVMAASYIGARAGYPNLITYDMGGTSTDVALVQGGLPSVTDELELEYAMPIHVPMVDVHTIGAGGGSLARVDEAGLLRVGPESAGAMPGPICYGRGGTRPTITDANLLLGRLNPERLLSVDSPVGRADLEQAFTAAVGDRLGLAPDEAAAAIRRVANDRMAGAVRMVSLARGHDPRDYALFAFGGAGPLHAVALARELGIPVVIIPARPGITNAIGCAVADLRQDFTRTVNRPLETVTAAEIEAVLAEQAAEGRRTLTRQGVTFDQLVTVSSADMQFRGQTHLLNVPLTTKELDPGALRGAFERAYHERFGIELPEIGAMLVNLKTSIIGRRRPVDPALFAASRERAASLADARAAQRPVWFETGWATTLVYRRERLPLEATIEGPALIEQLDTTTVLEPGSRARLDRLGNLLVEVGA